MITPSDDKTDKCFTEYVIKIRDETSSLSEKHITYEPLYLGRDNADLSLKVESLYLKFKKCSQDQESPEITVRSKMVWQA